MLPRLPRVNATYSIVMLAALISSALALMSATRCLAMSSGDCSGTTAFTAIILAFMSSVLAISIILALSLAMMSLGVPAGAKMENQIGTSAPVMPSSVSVGTLGKSGCRTWALTLSRM